MNRRRLLSALVALPVAGKAAAEAAVAELSQVRLPTTAPLGGSYGIESASIGEPTKEQYRFLLSQPEVRKFVESTVFESERHISSIDPDLACMRSFSLNAKIAFQRQRNVERQIERMQSDYPWTRMNRYLLSLVGVQS